MSKKKEVTKTLNPTDAAPASYPDIEGKEARQRKTRKMRATKHIVLMSKGDLGSFSVEASESEGIRTEADVRAWMNEHEYIGTLYGVRFTRIGEAGEARGYTRQPQTTIKFE